MRDPHETRSSQIEDSWEARTDEESVRGPARISATLAEINRQLVPVAVRLDPEGPLYDSLLSRLEPVERRLYLDHVDPLQEPAPLRPDQAIQVFISLRGTAIRFSVTVQEVLVEDGKGLIRCDYPTEILYLKRREIFRVQLPHYDQRRVCLRHLDSDHEIDAQLLDLSVKGFSVELESGRIDPRQIGTPFEYTRMELPGLRGTVSGEAVLVNLRPSSRSGCLSAGFSMIDLDPQTERSLMRASLYYQRRARRMGD